MSDKRIWEAAEPPVVRAASVPAEGQIPAFDAGWDAHALGLERETVRVLTPPSGRAWALLAWDTRQLSVERALTTGGSAASEKTVP